MTISSMKNESSRIRQYLLGTLAEKEVEELDLQIISDESFEEKFLVAEHELVEDYLEGVLSAEEKKLFRDNFLASCEERRKLFQDVSLLKEYAKNRFESGSAKVGGKKTMGGIWEILKNLFSPKLSPASAVFALLIAGAVFWGIWQIFFAGSVSPLEREFAALNQRDLSSTTDFAGFSDVQLSPGVFRDTNSAAVADKLKAEKLTENVFFRLALPFEVGKDGFFKFDLSKDEKIIFTQNQIRVYQNASGQEARLLLPKSILAKGQYQIKLQNAADKNSTVIYGFTVE